MLNEMERNKVMNAVNKALKNVGNRCCVDVVELAKSFGFLVGNAIMDDLEEGFILINPNKNIHGLEAKKVIGVNHKKTLPNKRFIIAHELGHYFLHSEEGKKLYAHKDSNTNEREEDADLFASYLLMPKDEFDSKIRELKNKFGEEVDEIQLANELATSFNVESTQVLKRIKNEW